MSFKHPLNPNLNYQIRMETHHLHIPATSNGLARQCGEFYQNGEYDKGIQLAQSLQNFEDNSVALRQIALGLAYMGEYPKSRRYFELSSNLSSDPHIWANCTANIGTTFFEEWDLVRAQETYEEALEYESHNEFGLLGCIAVACQRRISASLEFAAWNLVERLPCWEYNDLIITTLVRDRSFRFLRENIDLFIGVFGLSPQFLTTKLKKKQNQLTDEGSSRQEQKSQNQLLSPSISQDFFIQKFPTQKESYNNDEPLKSFLKHYNSSCFPIKTNKDQKVTLPKIYLKDIKTPILDLTDSKKSQISLQNKIIPIKSERRDLSLNIETTLTTSAQSNFPNLNSYEEELVILKKENMPWDIYLSTYLEKYIPLVNTIVIILLIFSTIPSASNMNLLKGAPRLELGNIDNGSICQFYNSSIMNMSTEPSSLKKFARFMLNSSLTFPSTYQDANGFEIIPLLCAKHTISTHSEIIKE